MQQAFFFFISFFFFCWTSLFPTLTHADQALSIHTLQIRGSINPAQEDLLKEAITNAFREQSLMLVVQLDTPGGLGETTRNMVRQILNAPLPVAIWVGPDGSRAASAGVFLVASSAIAGMSPNSNIGSARPVGVGGEDIPEAMADKILNDFLSLVRSSAQSRGRNVDWYISAVTESANLTGTESAMQRVVEFVAVSIPDFVEQIGIRGFDWQNERIYFQIDDVQFIDIEPGLWYSILSWMLDPQIAYFLLMGGLAGIFFELTNPGAIFPGVLGGLCLLLGLYALSILPTNVAGLLLILFGLMLFGLELMVTSFGLLSIAATIAIFFGSVILFRFEYGLGGVHMATILVTTAGISAFMAFCIYLVARAHHHKPFTGPHKLIGGNARVLRWSGQRGMVHLHGESWSAESQTPMSLEPGDLVTVAEVDGLVLKITHNQPHNDTGG
ncbi:membrane-bound serine protease (ClpP class) [Desulfonatronum thiosulfatophilum]|uniref:Membrane-bound serine protease (ClpP class) n=1 Tax=Desulfonatronum thiosulfatophilum TaxID=617002 RepID=A0A1G6B8F3_9BACT|nr:nodulation protein NfeD [Desulfonatronum thiosulfatophilum]SDB16904.1 membrane-bound serine protease (ClpP class) [Desulfonatronum thiosulfatophilum]